MIDQSFWRSTAAGWIRINNDTRTREEIESTHLKEYVKDDMKSYIEDDDDEL